MVEEHPVQWYVVYFICYLSFLPQDWNFMFSLMSHKIIAQPFRAHLCTANGHGERICQVKQLSYKNFTIFWLVFVEFILNCGFLNTKTSTFSTIELISVYICLSTEVIWSPCSKERQIKIFLSHYISRVKHQNNSSLLACNKTRRWQHIWKWFMHKEENGGASVLKWSNSGE